MNKKSPRQVVSLKEWTARHPKSTDPHYSGRLVFDRNLLPYLIECIESEEAPELFCSLWVNEKDGKAALGLAVPMEWISPRNRASREDFDEWMN